MKLYIAGLGLIGGSLAKAVKAKTNDIIIGFDRSEEVIQGALASKTIDEYSETIPKDTDLILIALFPQAAIDFVKENIGEIPKEAIIIDMCGVKRRTCSEISDLLKETSTIYIGGHPMAGREISGFGSSSETLFDGADMILTPGGHVSKNHCLLAEMFFLRIGFGKITYSTPEAHDEIIAFTSQLAHVVSNAYVQSPTALIHKGFSADSFKDMTRVAQMNEKMWSELFIENADYLSPKIKELIEKLEEFKNVIDKKDEQTLIDMLRQGSMIKKELNSKDKK